MVDKHSEYDTIDTAVALIRAKCIWGPELQLRSHALHLPVSSPGFLPQSHPCCHNVLQRPTPIPTVMP